MAGQTPELEAKMDGILGKFKLVEDGTQKATRLHESVAELDAQISRVSARVPYVEKLEGRLNSLNALSADVDQKLEDQLARQLAKARKRAVAKHHARAQLKVERAHQAGFLATR